jgi:serine/threonine-protein kinase SRPK3
MGLDFLNRICRVIHTDLKPENVLVCLTEDELKRIVEDEQLTSGGDFADRLNYYCQKYNMGPVI